MARVKIKNRHWYVITSYSIHYTKLYDLSMIAHFYTLNGIKSKTVGDGQHGVARFLTGKEIKKVYQLIKYDVKHWREGKNLPTEQGLVVGVITSYSIHYTKLYDIQ